jgi:ferric-dicitrate binding protein FerR (iron transport regulator)
MDRNKTIEEAGRWFAALRRGVMSTEEQSTYEAWLGQNENRKAMASMKGLWILLSGVPQPALLSDRTRGLIVSGILIASVVIATISVAGTNHFWTTLDWANR